MKRRFILLIDAKEESKSLLKFAGNWAAKIDAELLVIHQVYSMAPGIGEVEVRLEIKRHERKTALAEITNFVADVLEQPVSVRFYVTTGNLETAIHKLQSSRTKDLIFVGMKSKNWLERLFFQNTAIRLYNEINKPILVLPEGFEGNDFESLQVAITPKFPLNEELFYQLLAIIAATGKKVALFSVLKPNETDEHVIPYFQLLTELFSTHELSYEIVRHEDIVEGIIEHMQSRPGILVLQKGSRALTDYFRPYVVNDLLHLSKMPVIILP